MRWGASIPAQIAAFALPPRCAGCGQIVAQDLELCVACWQSLDFLTGEGCDRCGVPLSGGLVTCAPCLQAPPVHDGVLAAVAYGDVARHLALRLKHSRRIGLARLFAKLMAGKLEGLNGLLIPVPLHRWRLWQRGFNQSALMARHLSVASGLPVSIDALERSKATPVLRELGRHDREKAVRGAFRVPPAAREMMEGRNVILVDDVYTSGATANACARALKQAKAKEVKLLCWARVRLDDAHD